MDEQALAKQIAAQVLRDTQFWIAWVGVIGGVVGAALTIAGNVLLHWLQSRKANELDAGRRKLLGQMLDLREWRKLSTLSRVIGADADTTRRLLIEIGARGSEKHRADDEEVWGRISKNPLDKIDADALGAMVLSGTTSITALKNWPRVREGRGLKSAILRKL